MKNAALFLMFLMMSVAVNAHARELLSPEHEIAIAQDIENNFSEKINEASISAIQNETILAAKDQKVMLKALYAGISGPLSLAGVNIDEHSFYSKVGGLLVKGSRFGVLPSAITIGYFKRADLMVGKSFGTEMNFYLEEGKLKVSTYDLRSLHVGVAANFKIGYYVALCFGSCTGGDAKGTYIGVDADLVYGAGAGVYIEVGVDTTDFYKAKKIGQSYSRGELYQTKVVYIGVGLDIGLGVGLSMGFTEYDLKSDRVIMDLYSEMKRPDFYQDVKAAFDRADLFKSAPRLH